MLGLLLQLQVAGDSAAKAINQPTEHSISLWEMASKGGPILIPIFLLSVWALYIFFERLLTIQKLKVDNRFMQQIRDHVFNGNIDAAKAYCRQTNSPIARMIEKGLMRLGKPINEIENAIENAGKVEVFKLEKNLGIMSTIAGLAPMFGFLGTMLGVIKIFYNMAHQASLDQGMIATISEGLYVKMVSSAAGLLVGIIAYSAYHYLNHRIERVINSMEVTAIEFMDLLEEPVKS